MNAFLERVMQQRHAEQMVGAAKRDREPGSWGGARRNAGTRPGTTAALAKAREARSAAKAARVARVAGILALEPGLTMEALGERMGCTWRTAYRLRWLARIALRSEAEARKLS